MMKIVKPAVLSFSLLAFAGALYADDAKKEQKSDKQAQQSQTQQSTSSQDKQSQQSTQDKQSQQSTQGGASASGSAATGASSEKKAEQSTQGGASASGTASGSAATGSSTQSSDKKAEQSTQGGASASGSAASGTTQSMQKDQEKDQSAAAGASGGAKGTQGAMSVERLKDMKIVDSQGKDLGQIEDVVIDLTSGKVHAAVLSFGGFLGVGEKHYAFQPSELKPAKQKNQLTLDINKQKLENAEGFEKSQWPGMDDKYWSSVGKGQASAGSGGQSQAKSQGGSEGVKMSLIRAGEMQGQEVQDKSGKQVGKVQDVMVSLNEGQVRSIVVNVDDGGRATVPAKAISARGTDNKLVIDMSADQLRSQAKKSGGRQAGAGATGQPMDRQAEGKDRGGVRPGDVDNPLKADRQEKSEAPKSK